VLVLEQEVVVEQGGELIDALLAALPGRGDGGPVGGGVT